MIAQPLNSINKETIEALITNEERESRTLDYKEKLPTASRDDRKEFLADVSAFANAAGGDIVFGVRERREDGKPTGIPEAVAGLPGINADGITLQLGNLIRDGLEPRIGGVLIHVVEGLDAGPVVVIRIPKSWAAPHMIKAGDSRFFTRTSAGKYGMDVAEIRTAFALSETMPERVRRFRDERIARIVAEETPAKLPRAPKIILHLLPISALDTSAKVDLKDLSKTPGTFVPMNARGWSPRYNLDGFLSPAIHETDFSLATAYLQFFRHGAIEAVEATAIDYNNQYARSQGQKAENPFSARIIEKLLIDTLSQLLNAEKDLGLDPPVFVMLTFAGMMGRKMLSDSTRIDTVYPFDRDVLILPEVLVENLDEPADVILHPIFDALWQASGVEGCRHYKDGRWTPNV